MRWAKAQKEKKTCVIGAVIQFSSCLNLMDTGNAGELADTYIQNADCIRTDRHIQLCVRNPVCIIAYFRPKMKPEK
jgi:hypothetical protein